MAKQFLANRSGQTPTLDEVPNETIKIYATEAAADADLANLEENEIFATDEDNNPASGTQYPVDVVQDGNMNAVTSNAVYDSVVSRPRFPDYARGNLFTGSSANTYTTTEDCYVQLVLVASAGIQIKIDGVDVGSIDTFSNVVVSTFIGYVKKGQIITSDTTSALAPSRFKVFGLIGE